MTSTAIPYVNLDSAVFWQPSDPDNGVDHKRHYPVSSLPASPVASKRLLSSLAADEHQPDAPGESVTDAILISDDDASDCSDNSGSDDEFPPLNKLISCVEDKNQGSGSLPPIDKAGQPKIATISESSGMVVERLRVGAVGQPGRTQCKVPPANYISTSSDPRPQPVTFETGPRTVPSAFDGSGGINSESTLGLAPRSASPGCRTATERSVQRVTPLTQEFESCPELRDNFDSEDDSAQSPAWKRRRLSSPGQMNNRNAYTRQAGSGLTPSRSPVVQAQTHGSLCTRANPIAGSSSTNSTSSGACGCQDATSLATVTRDRVGRQQPESESRSKSTPAQPRLANFNSRQGQGPVQSKIVLQTNQSPRTDSTDVGMHSLHLSVAGENRDMEDEVDAGGRDVVHTPRKAKSAAIPTCKKPGPRRLPQRRSGQRGTAPVRSQVTHACAPSHSPEVADSIASYREWPLSDATLKCVQDQDRATFQLQFTWDSSCANHSHHPNISSTSRHSPTKREQPQASVKGKGSDGALQGSANDVYKVKRLLGRWRKNIFLIEWADGTSSWEPRENINEQLVRDFEATYKGFHEGVKMLRTRRMHGRKQYLLHWAGRPDHEKSWVAEKLISKKLVDEFSRADSA